MTEIHPGDSLLIIIVLSVIGGAIGLISAVISDLTQKGKEDDS